MRLIEYLSNNRFELSIDNKNRLIELDAKYGELLKTYRTVWKVNFPTNVESEYKKFIEHRKKGQKYFPLLNIEKDLNKIKKVRKGFQDLLDEWDVQCHLTKYYKEKLKDWIARCNFILDPERYIGDYIQRSQQTPSLEEFMKAIETMEANPYESVDDSNRDIDAQEAMKHCKEIMKNYPGFKVQFKDNQIPRMSVRSEELALNISPSAVFSDIDLEGLDVHEIEGHVARRFYGAKTGLNIFIYGLMGANDIDEGIAIWNSLHKVDKPKPNILFNIALKTAICYDMVRMDFCDMFDKYIRYGMPEEVLFKTLIRFKREIENCAIMSGNGDDQSYFCGYMKVKEMDQDMRDRLTRCNIGFDQLDDLENIEKFIKVNKFDSLI